MLKHLGRQLPKENKIKMFIRHYLNGARLVFLFRRIGIAPNTAKHLAIAYENWIHPILYGG